MEVTKKLSYYLEVLVDFAKHGDSLSLEAINGIQSQKPNQPHFLRKFYGEKTRQSVGIIGELFDKVNPDLIGEHFIRREHLLAVMGNFQLNPGVIKAYLGLEDSTRVKVAGLLKEVYEKVIRPMG
jgi:hypothetical protein